MSWTAFGAVWAVVSAVLAGGFYFGRDRLSQDYRGRDQFIDERLRRIRELQGGR